MSQVVTGYLPPNRNGRTWLGRAWALAGDVRWQFVALVAAPSLLAAIYWGLWAAPLYVSHAEYIVRGVEARRSSGLAQLLNTFGVSRAADETAAIESFLRSREVLTRLNAQIDLRAVYGAREADALARFPRLWERDGLESLYGYTRAHFEVSKESASGVTRLAVSAFDPASAQRIAAALLALAGEMANSLNARAQADGVETARRESEEARDALIDAQAELTAFRNRELMVDPLAFAGAMLQTIGALSLERARAQTQLNEAERLSPNNPALDSLKASAAALESRIGDERAKLAGDNSALAGKVAQYERLTLLRELAEKRYSAALASLEAAIAEARRKRIYIEEVVRPTAPDEPERPERLRATLSVFVVGFMAFSVLWILSVGSKDHAQ